MKAPLPLPMESGPPGNQHLAGSLEQMLLSTGPVWPDHPTDGGVSQGIPGLRTLSLPGGVESGRMERAEGCGDFRGSGSKAEASSLGVERWIREKTD